MSTSKSAVVSARAPYVPGMRSCARPRRARVSRPGLCATMLAIVGVALLSGCGGSSADTPQATVTGLLELRSANSTDAAAYASFVTTPVAEALAADSAAREEGSDAVPQWETPEVTKESDSAAEVRVAWVRSAEHSAWPETTTFVLQRVDDAWLIVDAVEEAPSDAAPGEDSR